MGRNRERTAHLLGGVRQIPNAKVLLKRTEPAARMLRTVGADLRHRRPTLLAICSFAAVMTLAGLNRSFRSYCRGSIRSL